jgi:Putative MetA-pathway of phenol degradation
MLIRHIVASVALLLVPTCAWAQELTPGAYWPLPVGINILTLVNNFSVGDIAFDPSLPVDDASARINATVVAYTRTLSLAGRSANLALQLPVVGGHVEGLYQGTPTAVDRFGLGDPTVRLGVNLYGAPAMTPKAFASSHMNTLIGVSLAVAMPLGEYDRTKVINLGTNRWSVRPEIGLVHFRGRWAYEIMAAVWLFSDNTDFFGGHTRAQDPIPSLQADLAYRFSPRVWLAGNANFYRGGRTQVDGKWNLDLQSNSRIGSTFSWALDQHHSLRASVSEGAYTTIGADFLSIAVGYNYAWTR